ncbi:MAG TPA: DUF11 domain-containing protein [Solirubrobacterales bacterium]|nr:DUF11 domain-containing protein [Solirubrobacterales bacterium]
MTATPPRFRHRRLPLLALAVLALSAATLWVGADGALAAGSSTEIKVERTNAKPQNSGAATIYRINFSCSSVSGSGESCGEDPTIRIPLDQLTSSFLETPPMNGGEWHYAASSGVAGLVKAGKVVGDEYVIELDATKVKAGDSDTVEFTVTPPNGTTPNGTAWLIEPSFETSEIPPVKVPAAADGEAAAKAELSVSKTTLDGSKFYVRGHEVTFNIAAQCFKSTSTGKLFMTEGSLVDQLPAGLEFVSATPEPTAVSGNSITWEYPDAESMPKGCGVGSEGPTAYQLIARIPATAADDEEFVNEVTFSGKPIDQEPLPTIGKAELTALAEPPADPGVFLGKTAQAPICIEGAGSGCYLGTYPGNWIKPINPAPSRRPGSAEGRFDINVDYTVSRAYETAVIDPMPCLENLSGSEYSSPAVVGEVKGTAVPACAEPAFHPTVVWVAAPSLEAALKEGWQPLAVLVDGTEVALSAGTTGEGGIYFDVPAGDVETVKAIELPPNLQLTDNRLAMSVFGYADGSLDGGDILHDVAYASAYPIGVPTAARTSNDDAKIFIEPQEFQLGINKSFGGLSLGTGGVKQLATMNLATSVSIPPGKALPADVILADWLPAGMTWSNPVAKGRFTIANGLTGPETVEATITHEADYREPGRELIRVTLPRAAFEKSGQGGFFTITPEANLFRMSVANETGTFANSAQIFLPGAELRGTCGNGQGTGTAEFESKDEADLSGTGEENEDFCQSTTELHVTVAGTPNLSLRKLVHGDAEGTAPPKGALGIGQANRHGYGVFSLIWSNNGTAPLKEPVIYDILPYVGDTGVDEGQAGNARESEFATEFKAITTLPAGVTVEYSTSTNPCRPEVNAAAPACEEDWSPTVPADPTTVRALKFFSGATYPPESPPLTIEFELRIPNGDVNDVAWNSAATDALTTGTTPTALLPAEPPKVGITAPAALIEPTIATAVSAASGLPGKPFSDTIEVEGTDELNGTAKWKLLGPVAPVANSCTGLGWAGAATVTEGEFALDPSATTTTEVTPVSAPTAHGCYGYEVTVEGPGFETTTSPAGTAGETVLIHPAGAVLGTQVSAASVLPEAEVTDAITVLGSEGFPGSAEWTLLGPVAPVAGACEAVDWTGAATVDQGTIAFAGDETKSTTPTAVTAHGCYGYEVTLEGEHLATVTSPVGSVGETVLVHPAAPTLVTHASAGSVLPGTAVTDAIAIEGTAGFAGTAAWRLAGPVAPGAGGSCEAADWTGAETVAEGEIEFEEDGTVDTTPATVTDHGCYGYEVVVEGEHLATTTSALGSAGETVLVHPATPILATTASPGSAEPGAVASDLITVSGAGSFAGTVHWKLLGPVAGSAQGCDGLDWSGAAVLAQGEFPIAGDGATSTPGTKLDAAGCYGYEVTVEGPHLVTVTSARGSAGETVLIKAPVPPATPVTAKAAAAPDLRITKRVDESSVEVGRPLHYTIEVENKGDGAAADTVVTDTPKTPLAFVSARSSRGSCGHSFPLTCRLGTLAPGAKVTIAVVATPQAGGAVLNSATVSSPDERAAKGGKGAHGVKAAAASRALIPLRLSKTVAPKAVEAGGRLHYAITVGNPTAATAHGLKVCDRLPAGLAYVSSSAPAKLSEGSYCWTIAALKGSAKKRIRVVARALAGAGGRLVNTAVLRGADAVRREATAPVRVKARPAREGGVTG